MGQQGLHKVEVDDEFRMRPDALAAAVEADVAAGVRPIAVVPTVGTTSTTSVDPVGEVAEIAARHGMWVHVDAAYGGAAGLLPSHRHLLDGCERAGSLVFNPHKWLLTPVDCSLLYTSRPEVLRQAFSVVPFYLTSGDGDVTNLMDYGLALGRRFRALKLWFVLRAYGADGLAEIIAGHIAMARELAGWIEAAEGWELLAPVPLSTVCFRRRPPGVDDEAELDRHQRRPRRARQREWDGVHLAHTGRRPLRGANGDRQRGLAARARAPRLGGAERLAGQAVGPEHDGNAGCCRRGTPAAEASGTGAASPSFLATTWASALWPGA